MSDKRRRARIQGGWASRDVSSPRGVSRQKTPLEKIRREGAIDDAKGSELHFKPSIQLQEKPAAKSIREPGCHVISKSRNGESRITLFYDFVAPSEQEWMFQQMEKEIPWEQRNVVIKGEEYTQPRLTCWFGDEATPYTYSGLTLIPNNFSPLLNMIRDNIKQKCGLTFNSLLANLYRNEKDSVDWHADDEKSLGPNPTIASVSLGCTRTFELRQNPSEGYDYTCSQHIDIPLPSGSLLLMEGAVQEDWQHRVPKDYHDRNPRINLTFRTIFP